MPRRFASEVTASIRPVRSGRSAIAGSAIEHSFPGRWLRPPACRPWYRRVVEGPLRPRRAAPRLLGRTLVGLEALAAGLLAGGRARQGRADRALVDLGGVVGPPVALREADERLQGGLVGLRVHDLLIDRGSGRGCRGSGDRGRAS